MGNNVSYESKIFAHYGSKLNIYEYFHFTIQSKTRRRTGIFKEHRRSPLLTCLTYNLAGISGNLISPLLTILQIPLCLRCQIYLIRRTKPSDIRITLSKSKKKKKK